MELSVHVIAAKNSGVPETSYLRQMHCEKGHGSPQSQTQQELALKSELVVTCK